MMKAAVLTQLNSPLEVEELEEPSYLDYGQVLVRVVYSTICGAQIGEIDGAKGPDKYLPHLMGHEGCGYAVQTGPGVIHIHPGDKVIMHWRKGVGIESKPPKYRRKDGTFVGGGWVTTFNEYAVVSENRLTPITSNIPASSASLLGCAVTTALGLISNEARLGIGQSIAVTGCGGVGLNVIQGACIAGANPIIGIDHVPSKLGMARVLGATHTVDASRSSIKVGVKTVVPGGVDVLVDCTGVAEVIDAAYSVVAPGGKMILVGQTPANTSLNLSNFRQHYCGKTIMDSQGGLTNPTVDIPRYISLYEVGKLKLDHQVTDTFRLEDINKAIDLVRTGTAGRVGISMEGR